MIYTAQDFEKTLPDDLHVDICIIGSGAGGAVAAAKLSQKGYNVVIIEEGDYVTYKDFNQDERQLIPKMYRRSAGLATDDMSIRILQGKVYGGSTTINWMASFDPPENVLEEWERDYGLEDYTESNLRPFLDEVRKRLSLYKVPLEEHNPGNMILLNGTEKLGYHGDSIFINAKDCIGCGKCGLGCYYDAKQDMRLTYLKDAQENETIVYTNTRAEYIQYHTKDSQTVKATILREKIGKQNHVLSIHTKKVVVAAGAIYTPIILQKSGLTKGGVVGKYLRLHPVTSVLSNYSEPIHPTYGISMSTVSKEFLKLDENGYGFWLEVPDLEPFLAGVNYPFIGQNRRKGMQELTNTAAMLVLVRDGANGKSNGEVRLRRGFNAQNGAFTLEKIPSIRYRLSSQDREHMIRGIEEAVRINLAAGAQEVLTLHTKALRISSTEQIKEIRKVPFGPNKISLFSAHPMGTARMGTSTKNSVVGPDMQMHFYPGIYVMDGSIMPTALGVNPMITILASVSNALSMFE